MDGENVSTFVIGRLRDLLVKEGAFLQDLTVSVDKLAEMLTRMEELLEYAHVRQNKLTSEIIDLADHMIDSIETYVFRVVNKHTGLREYLMRRNLCLAIEKITAKIIDFFNIQIEEGSSIASSGSKRAYKAQDFSVFNNKDFIGREEDINKLVSYLVDQKDEKYQIVSIFGMGGLGKTTLAWKVYNDNRVFCHFQCCAFVCVRERCQSEEILKHILQQLTHEKEDEIKGMTDVDVIERLQRVQGEKRCLVVIDDIWSIPDWESLNRGLPDGSTGGKVLLTTRIKDVAEMGFCYILKFLSEDECWELCQKKTFTCQDPKAEMRREELGREMISWCGGIPQAVLVLRGALSTKGSLWEWERFYKSKTWRGEGDQKFNAEMVEGLLFSYEDLPYHLRPCFLYLATFDEDEKIDVEMLYMLWVAEGMILSKDREVGETMMDVAERYLSELVGRSMIEAELDDQVHPNVTMGYKSCWLHDLMRSLCLSIAKKEYFLDVCDYRVSRDKVVVLHSSCLRNDARISTRQVFYFYRKQDFSVHGDDKHEATRQVRSLMFKAGHAGKLSMLKKLNLLRVLSFDDTSIGKEDFSNDLIHLRYLSLNLCSIIRFPSSIYNLMYLQTLDMRVYCNGVIIPNLALRKLRRLRHLFLPNKYDYKVSPDLSKLRLDALTELETLVNIDSTMCEMKDVIELTNLRRLEWTICISSENDGEEFKEFMNKMNLDPSRYSSLAIDLVNPEVEMHSKVLRGQVPELCEKILREMEIRDVSGELLPEFSNFSQLTVLSLTLFEVEKDPMPTLEKLSNLKELTLLRGKLKGKEITCSKTGFPQLIDLTFHSLENWEKWVIEEGAMPKLHCLRIWNCSRLEMLPDELEFITTLVYLRIRYMPEEFTRRLIGGAGGEGPDFYKIRCLKVEII